MSKVLSEVLFNRTLIWLVMAALTDDNSWLKGAYIVLAVFNMAKSLKAWSEEDA